MQDAQKLVIIDVSKTSAEMHFTQIPKVSPQLPQSDVNRKLPYFREDCQRLTLQFRNHGKTSPILGSPANAFGNLPITSTRIIVPGESLAIRVARVTPLYSMRTPSDPSYTHGGGILVDLSAKRDIWRASLDGSAPSCG
jgi:hypothetical protein